MEDTSKRVQIGQIATKLFEEQILGPYVDPREVGHEQLKRYQEEFQKAIVEGKQRYNPDTDFYIEVASFKDRVFENLSRNYPCARQTCPTPKYCQIVYRYHRKENREEFLWILPSQKVAAEMIKYKHYVVPEAFEVLGYVLAKRDGSLLKKAKMLNGEDKLITGISIFKNE